MVTKVKRTLLEVRNRNKSVTRNVSHFKPIKMPVSESDDESDHGEDSRDNTQIQDNGRDKETTQTLWTQEISDSHRDNKLFIEVIEQ